MPDGYSIQIDPNGQPTDLLTVTYTTQTPTPEQQAQARKNIGAISQEQLDQALENIPAGGGSIAVTDDGNGNVTINSQALTVTDDGNGNVSLN